MAGVHLSKEFFDLIKSIGEAKSKQVRALGRTRATRWKICGAHVQHKKTNAAPIPLNSRANAARAVPDRPHAIVQGARVCGAPAPARGAAGCPALAASFLILLL